MKRFHNFTWLHTSLTFFRGGFNIFHQSFLQGWNKSNIFIFISLHSIGSKKKSRLISSAPMFLQFCKKYSRVDVRGRCLDELHPINITFFCVKKLHCEPTHILTCEAKHDSLISINYSAKRIGLETPKAYQEVLSSKMVSSVRQNLITILRQCHQRI